MDYKVVITEEAEGDLEKFIRYLLIDKQNPQAAQNLLDDFVRTKENLAKVAGSLSLCTNQRLKMYGYRRINFMSHRYFMLYRIEDDLAIVDNIFHELQDYENCLI